MTDLKVSEKPLHSQLTDGDTSALQRYQSIALGTESLLYLLKFELIMLFVSGLPGALGLVLRKSLYPMVLGSIGRNVIFGRNVSIRHGAKISIGDNVVIDDNVTLDAKGENNSGISIGSGCILSKNTILSCKNGDIEIGSDCMIGINTVIHAIQGSKVVLGDNVLIAAFVYLMGSGSYGTDDTEMLFKDQGIYPQGGIDIKTNVWIGSNAQVLDGVTIGTGSIVGSSSVVKDNIEEYEVVAGVPAKHIRSRKSA